MSFFESLVALMLIAILLLQASRRLSVPYPALLAAAGVVVAFVPDAPTIRIDPEMALALFIAPALLDAAYDFPVGAIWKLWRPLFALAVVAVLLTTATVAWIGWAFAGMPLAVAVALGAIVAPPDAAAATAVLRQLSLPRRSVAVLQGESLLNDALALLLFVGAVAVQENGGLDGSIGLRLAVAAPGGVLLGIALAWIARRVGRFVRGTLGGNLLEFVYTFSAWIIAEHLGLSAVLCVVAFAMTIARSANHGTPARVRVHSFAVWTSAVFFLNVLAFLLMGMQARMIIDEMPVGELRDAGLFAGAVTLAVISVRLLWVLIYNRLAARFRVLRGPYEPATVRQGFIVGWCGMRGLVTLAAAFALPSDFPQRDLIVLTAFSVVLATLLLQGLTLAPLIRLLKLDRTDGRERELTRARLALAEAGLASLSGEADQAAAQLRIGYTIERDAAAEPPKPDALERWRDLGLSALRAQRMRLEALRIEHAVGPDAYQELQEELDWRELALTAPSDRMIEEN